MLHKVLIDTKNFRSIGRILHFRFSLNEIPNVKNTKKKKKQEGNAQMSHKKLWL